MLKSICVNIICAFIIVSNMLTKNAFASIEDDFVVITSCSHLEPSSLTRINISFSYPDIESIEGFYYRVTTSSSYTVSVLDIMLSSNNTDLALGSFEDNAYYFYIAAYSFPSSFPPFPHIIGPTTRVGPLIVDTTPPIVHITGPSKTNTSLISLEIGADERIDSICISEGAWASCDWNDLTPTDGTKINYELLSGEGMYNLKIQSQDLAGNIANADPFPVTFSKSSSNLNDGLVAYYPFDANATDMSGNGNHGTPTNNVSFVNGLNGQAAKFHGVDNPGHICVTKSDSLNFDKQCTFAFFARLDNTKGMNGYGNTDNYAGQCVFAKRHDRAGIYCQVRLNASNEFSFGLGMNANTSNNFGVWGTSNEYEKGTWVHLVYVLTTTKGIIYVNGVKNTEREDEVVFSYSNKENLYFGKFSDYWYPFDGALDEFRIYNRALTEIEIQNLCQQYMDISFDNSSIQFVNIPGKTTNEDTPIYSIPFTITSTTTTACDLTLSFETDESSLILSENISYTCLADTFYISLTPATDINGTAIITITAIDSDNLTSSTSFNLTVLSINDAPIVEIPDQTTTKGSTFMPIVLDDYISDVDHLNSKISWTVTGQSDLIITITNRIATIAPPYDDWHGTERIIFTATDPDRLTSTDVVMFTRTQTNPIHNPTTQIAAGYYHNLILKKDGTVWAWGRNYYGQLGDGTTTNKNKPVQVIDLENVQQVAAGEYHSLALKQDGTVWAWGRNADGQLGDGTTIDRNTPVKVSNLENVSFLDLGNIFSLALKENGTVWLWGYYENNFNLSPIQIESLQNIIMLSAGEFRNLALKNDGTVWTWGCNDYFFCFDDTGAPEQVTGLSQIIMIETGCEHNLALKEDGTIWAWGDNYYGQLGDGTTTSKNTPERLEGISHIKKLSAGVSHSLALKADGTSWVWGSNNNGQLGDGTNISKNKPVLINFEHITDISAGHSHSLALKDDGTVWVWGDNKYGQLGSGISSNYCNLQKVSGISNVKLITAGDDHSLAITEDGMVWTWGYNSSGQLGDRTTQIRSSPVKINDLTQVQSLKAGRAHSLALKVDGTVWAWGSNSFGQLGNGTSTNKDHPVSVSGLENVKTLAAGCYYSLALKEDGTVWAWGSNTEGQLGDGTSSRKNTPVKVSGLNNIIMLVELSSNSSNFALKEDLTVWAWGINTSGTLLDGTTNNKYSPVQIFGLNDIAMLTSGPHCSRILKNDGTVWTWGKNFGGQLGDGTTSDKSTPVQVIDLEGVKRIAPGCHFTLALKNDNTVWAWGNNDNGQLGDGTTTDASSPVQVVGLDDVSMIAAGHDHSLALKDDGSVWAWGKNESGQIGNGFPTYFPEPVLSEIQLSSNTFVSSHNTILIIPVMNTARKNISISYTTEDDTATAGIDYEYTSGILTFQENEHQKNISITILNNPGSRNDKTFLLKLDAPDIFLNSGGQSLITISSGNSVNAPYSQTFTQNMPATGWTYYSSKPTGRIQQTLGRLRMDNSQEYIPNLNEAILNVVLPSAENIHLKFFQKSIASDICTSLPETYTGHFYGDGVSLSTDGHTWYRIIASDDLLTDNLGEHYTIDLSALESSIQTNFNENFHLSDSVQIKFQQYGQRTYPSGGREWDNI